MRLFQLLLLSLLLAAATPAAAQLCPPTLVKGGPAVRGLYVSGTETIVGNNAKEAALLNYAHAQGFNYLMLYGVKTLLTVPSDPLDPQYAFNRSELGSFIRAAHEFYHIDVGVNVSSQSAAVPILDFLDWPLVVFDPLMRFDAVHYESEYWNGDTDWATWSNDLAWLDGQCDAEGLICEVYLGNPSHDTSPVGPNATGQAELDFIVAHADRIQVTYYRPDPMTPAPNLYLDRTWRLHYLAHAAGPARIVVLLNGKPGAEPNMFNWLMSQPGTMAWRLAQPFRIWRNCAHGHIDNLLNDTDGLGLPLNNIEVLGYSWYRYPSIVPVLRKAAGAAER